MLFNLAVCVEPLLDESFSLSGALSFVESRCWLVDRCSLGERLDNELVTTAVRTQAGNCAFPSRAEIGLRLANYIVYES